MGTSDKFPDGTTDEPIACTLSDTELTQRRRTLLASLQRRVVRTEKLPTGYAYDFQSTPEMSAEVHRVVQLERECCGFLRFRITEGSELIRMEVTGPEEALPLIRDFFGDGA